MNLLLYKCNKVNDCFFTKLIKNILYRIFTITSPLKERIFLMLFTNVVFMPFLILFSSSLYTYIKKPKTMFNSLLLNILLFLYTMASLLILFSFWHMKYRQTILPEYQYHLFIIIIGIWGIGGILFFLYRVICLLQSLFSSGKVAFFPPQFPFIQYLFVYNMISFLLAFYWFHPVIWRWFHSLHYDRFLSYPITENNVD